MFYLLAHKGVQPLPVAGAGRVPLPTVILAGAGNAINFEV